jgi:hypothetical protein
MSGDPARWSEEELNAYMARYNGITPAQAAKVTAHLPADVREFGKAFEAKGRVQQPHTGSGRMNKTEALYAELLEAQRLAGNVIEWEFEPGPLLLSPKQGTIPATRYWRDFRAVMKSGVVMAIEVKAGRKSKAGVPHPHFEDGARERLQMAAKKFVEYEWELAWYYVGTWHIERIR